MIVSDTLDRSAELTFSTSVWTAAQVAEIAVSAANTVPLVTAEAATPALENIDLWDSWPLQTPDGVRADVAGGTLWFMLSAAQQADPGDRHGLARIRLVLERDGAWLDCGRALPDGLNPGSREWAGSAVWDAASGVVTLYFTAAGYSGEEPQSFAQRLFEVRGTLDLSGALPAIINWSAPVESVAADGVHYMIVNQREGQPGFIKAFRDPAFFRDPADGQEYLLFTASLAASDHGFNGAIGIARKEAGGWALLPPLLHADQLNNELERAHMVAQDGLYYLFWSTQRRVFAPGVPSGPNGLYGAVGETPLGPFRPLNGSGLVAGNPEQEPIQCYSWWVLDGLEVASFVDHWGLEGRSFEDHPSLLRQQFGGTPAPRFRLVLEGDKAEIA